MTGRSFAIIPAAGRSTRMGAPKLLLPWKSSTILENVLDAWRAGGVSERVVIVHPEDQDVADVARRAGATVIVPEMPPPSMKDSVLVGLRHIESHWRPTVGDAWLVAPADMPLISARVIQRLLAANDGLPQAILRVTTGKKTVHPSLFSWDLAAAVGNLPAEVGINGLDTIIMPQEILLDGVPVDADLDTPADYDRLYNRYGRWDPT